MKIKILGICGSTRKESSNKSLIRAVSAIFIDSIETELFTDLECIPIFNPDTEEVNVPSEVSRLKQMIAQSDGVLICTPEYAMGVPGGLKNAMDWCVSSIVFSKKPTALITASLHGVKGHHSLMETLKVIECNITGETELIIPAIKSKLKGDQIIDPETELAVKSVIRSLISLTNK